MDAPVEEFGLRDLLLIVRRQRRLIIGGTLVGLVGGLVALQRIEPTYEASASIRIDEAAVGVPEFSLIGGLPGGNQIGTDMEVIRSRALADAVVDSLGLRVVVARPQGASRSSVLERVRVAPEADTMGARLVRVGDRFEVQGAAPGSAPGTVGVGTPFRIGGAELVLAAAALEHPEIELRVVSHVQAREALRGLIEVERPSRDANIIRVRARGVDPALVRDIPNVLATGFVAHRQSIQKARARSTADFLRQQLDTLAVQLSAAEDRLRSFRESGQVINLQVEGSTQVQRLADLQAERASLESEHSALAQLVAEVRQSSAALGPGDPSPYRRLLAFPSLLRNQSAAELLRSLTNLEDQRATLLTRRSVKDPDVVVLSERIRALEGQLQDIITTYLSGLSNQIGAMDGSLATFEARLDQIPARELQFARLARQAQVLEEIYGQLQTRLKEAEVAQAVEDPSVRIVDVAAAPTSPASPRRALILGFALMLGLIAGTGGGFLREYLDGTVRTRGDALYATGVPVLGMVPRISLHRPEAGWRQRVLRPAWKRLRPAAAVYGGVMLTKWDALTARRAISAGEAVTETTTQADEAAVVDEEETRPEETVSTIVVRPDSVASVLVSRSNVPSPLVDAYDRLHSNILFSAPDTEFRTLLLTSALPGDGKTTNAVNLALSLAQKGLKVLLIDADMRRGTVAGHFNARRSPGLAEALTGASDVPQCLQQIDLGGGGSLDLLASGAFPPNPAQMLGSDRMASMLEYLSTVYDKIVLDSPPLNIVVDAAMLAKHVDGVVLVARTGVTPFDALAYAAEQFRAAQMPVIGVVLNDIDFQRDAAYDSAYQWYGYGEAYYSSSPQ